MRWIRALCEHHLGPNHNQLFPSFFIVGPPRTGTSWLHAILKERTVLPRTKETRFFDTHFHRGMNWYRAHYSRSNGSHCVREVAPTYFASPAARRRIKELVPNARIVCIFRHPVERVLSLYRLKRAYGMIPWSFEQAVLRDPELTESSRYATHLRAWQQEFGTDRVLPTLYDDLRDNPQAYLDTLADFIRIPHFSLSCREMRSVLGSEGMAHPRSYYWTHSATLVADWLKARRLDRFVTTIRNSPLRKLFLGGGPAFTGISSDVSLALKELFRGEVEALEAMVQRDLSAWKPSRTELRSSELDEESFPSGQSLL